MSPAFNIDVPLSAGVYLVLQQQFERQKSKTTRPLFYFHVALRKFNRVGAFKALEKGPRMRPYSGKRPKPTWKFKQSMVAFGSFFSRALLGALDVFLLQITFLEL